MLLLCLKPIDNTPIQSEYYWPLTSYMRLFIISHLDTYCSIPEPNHAIVLLVPSVGRAISYLYDFK